MKDRVKAIRKHFDLSQEQFAKRIGKTTGFISNVETGRSGLSESTISSICSAYDIDKEWLKSGNGQMFSHRVEKNPAVDKTQIGSRIKEIRKKAGLTQAEFGDRIGFHKNQVYYVEVGKSIPSDGFIAAVCREFRVSYSWLRTGEANERDPVDDRLIEWLRRNPEVARELRIRGGLD